MQKHGYTRPYTETFKYQAIDMVLDGKFSISKTARLLNVSRSTVQRWLKAYGRTAINQEQCCQQTHQPRDTVQRLKYKNYALKNENACLKKLMISLIVAYDYPELLD